LDNLTNQLSQAVQTLKPQAVPKSAEVLQPGEITSEEVQIPGRQKKKKRSHSTRMSPYCRNLHEFDKTTFPRHSEEKKL